MLTWVALLRVATGDFSPEPANFQNAVRRTVPLLFSNALVQPEGIVTLELVVSTTLTSSIPRVVPAGSDVVAFALFLEMKCRTVPMRFTLVAVQVSVTAVVLVRAMASELPGQPSVLVCPALRAVGEAAFAKKVGTAISEPRATTPATTALRTPALGRRDRWGACWIIRVSNRVRRWGTPVHVERSTGLERNSLARKQYFCGEAHGRVGSPHGGETVTRFGSDTRCVPVCVFEVRQGHERVSNASARYH